MQLSGILDAGGIKVLGASTSKKRLFHDIGDLANMTYGLDAAEVIAALLEREALGPTGVGKGVALPHARLPQLTAVHGLFLKLDQPLEFKAVDRKPVDLVFALLAPGEAGVEHLKALALVSRTLRDQDICTKLRANTDPATLHAILTETSAIQAA